MLLQHSGVGSAAHLRSLDIQVEHDLPGVGRNLQDHICSDFVCKIRKPSLNQQLHSWHGKAWQGLRYVLTRKGPLSLGVNQAGGFVRSNPSRSRPNLQLFFSPVESIQALRLTGCLTHR